MDTSLEHFAHIEDVVEFVKTHLPPDANTDTWKQVCQDVMHCELQKVEPLLLQQLQKTDGHAHTEEEIRGLLRAASWYTHPQHTSDVLIEDAETLKEALIASNVKNASEWLDEVMIALEQHLTEHNALPATEAIESLIEQLHTDPTLSSFLPSAQELRDQIYYQLLYPHWFATIEQWKQAQNKKGHS